MGLTRSLIMAGGRSERMRASTGGGHKALVSVNGVTLLEWNVAQLLRHGFLDIVVAVSTRDPEISDFVRASVVPVVAPTGARIELFEERTPLGNAGAARQVISGANNLLMIYVDNLTTLDLERLVDFHERGGFAATIATHAEPFQIPFGRLSLDGNRVVDYAEKPVIQVQVSSGTCVLSKKACDIVPEGRPIGISELFALLSERDYPVGAFMHDAPWVDINDAHALNRAHRLFEGRSVALDRAGIA